MSLAIRKFNIVKKLNNKRKVLVDWINPEQLSWDILSTNPNAISLLKNNIDKINWNLLSENPNAIKLLEEYPNKINWMLLSSNPNAINLLHLWTFKTPT